MSLISKEFAKELSGKRGFRHKYQGAQTCTKIVRQIRAMRHQRGWSQAQFAARLKKPASNVSQRLENLDYTGFSLKTLLEVAEACDVGLVVEFVPYREFIKRTSDLSSDNLKVEEFQGNELDEVSAVQPDEMYHTRQPDREVDGMAVMPTVSTMTFLKSDGVQVTDIQVSGTTVLGLGIGPEPINNFDALIVTSPAAIRPTAGPESLDAHIGSAVALNTIAQNNTYVGSSRGLKLENSVAPNTTPFATSLMPFHAAWMQVR